MRKIFIGLIFIFVNIEMHFMKGGFDLLPDFIGYILIFAGLKDFPEVKDYKKATPYCAILAIINVIYSTLYFMYSSEKIDEMITIRKSTMYIIDNGISIISMIMIIAVLYYIVDGLKELEQKYMEYFYSIKLNKIWKINFAFDIILTLIKYGNDIIMRQLAKENGLTIGSNGLFENIEEVPKPFAKNDVYWMGEVVDALELRYTVKTLMVLVVVITISCIVVRGLYLVYYFKAGTKYKKVSVYGTPDALDIAVSGSSGFNGNNQSMQYGSNSGYGQVNNSGADEIIKFKRLLDVGVITEEEYEAKKKQLLGLDVENDKVGM